MTGNASAPLDAARTRHRVVIIGGGFAGVQVARGLSGTEALVTLIDRTNHHLFQPLLYQVATGVLSSGQIAPALRGMFRRSGNVEVMLADVEAIDVDARTLTVCGAEPTQVGYDTLVVAAGATHSYFGHDDWAALAPGMKTLKDAVQLRSRILGAFEMAEQESDPDARRAWLTFAIVGAGPTGVELAGQIAILARDVLRGEYRHIDTAEARVVLLDTTENVLGGFAVPLRDRARRDLTEMGVEVQLEAMVTEIDADGVTVGEEGERRRLAARTVIWAAGVRASPLGEELARATGAEVDRAGRLHVGPGLTLPGHPEVFALGDMITIKGVPGVAQPAMQEGKYVARTIKRRLTGRTRERPFRYVDLGMMAVIGRKRAVADLFGKVRVGGFPAFLIWAMIHLAYLVGWGNRFGAVTRWMWTVLARNRRERLIDTSALAAEVRAGQAMHDVSQANGRRERVGDAGSP